MGDAFGVLGLMAFLVLSFVAVWVISGAAERYLGAAERYLRRKSDAALPAASGSIWDGLKGAVGAVGSTVGGLVTGLVGCLGSLIGCLVALVLSLVGLFFMVWLVKRMLEAA